MAERLNFSGMALILRVVLDIPLLQHNQLLD
jgi:hypothetical protein